MGARERGELAAHINNTDWRDKVRQIAAELQEEANAVNRIEARLRQIGRRKSSER